VLPTKRPEVHYRVIYIYSAKPRLNKTVPNSRTRDRKTLKDVKETLLFEKLHSVAVLCRVLLTMTEVLAEILNCKVYCRECGPAKA